ncbi:MULTISPECIES: TrbC/VirB2 family protein [Dyella]|uniref:TrbC/VirB2 family protein n=1 Tax=Dyella TaxID=231454 RepID=UPI000C83C5D8|nr:MULTISPECIES: TrbC/VirB2 family protein [Dyella]MDR3444993.1 TrbC/VirB2 family protein [Dyella sp.]PMQ05049.1 Type IV secretion system protein virB2 [Dyella sp. AD56]ULU26926.1 TrbC/VirB2 family protein [Dyella terrae]
MAIKPFINTTAQRKRMLDRAVILTMTAAIILPGMAFADDAQSNLCGVLGTVNTLLNVASFAIVTIAIIFSGYQIAFAHKRITEVAPALIGGVLIGAAAQIAKMVIGGSSSASTTCGGTSNNTTMLLDHVHSAVQFLQHYA